VLAQIIFDEESSGQQLLPVQFLRQLIQFYGDSVQAFVPSYLEMSIKSFASQQERMREQMAAGANAPLSIFEETVRQNMALFEQGMRMMSPFATAAGKPVRSPEPAKPSDDDFSDLKAQVAALQARLDRMGE
jgi:polyhydroxyalkanoate synthesis regulator protein